MVLDSHQGGLGWQGEVRAAARKVLPPFASEGIGSELGRTARGARGGTAGTALERELE